MTYAESVLTGQVPDSDIKALRAATMSPRRLIEGTIERALAKLPRGADYEATASALYGANPFPQKHGHSYQRWLNEVRKALHYRFPQEKDRQ